MLLRLLSLVVLVATPSLRPQDITVKNAAEFRAAGAAAKAGTRILLAPGDYVGGFHFTNLCGEPGKPIVIASADPKNPAVIRDGNTGLHLSNPTHLELRDLVLTKHANNGVNIDDGSDTPPESARHILIRGLRVSDIGGDGNHDGIKLSGLWDFRVEECVIERWGTKGGSAIDMVGCHRGTIAGNTIRHVDPAPGNCTGVQGKGGTSEIAVQRNRFENAGGRAVNIGGSTGLQFFRPKLAGDGPHAEARAIRVEGNTFVGAVTPVAFVGVDGAVVRFNTIERPGRWALRILQETKAAGFVPSRNGEFTDNIIVFDSTKWGEGGVNIGAGAAPETFKFARNWWFAADNPARSQPRLPTPEVEGTYGQPPEAAKRKAGAEAWPGPGK